MFTVTISQIRVSDRPLKDGVGTAAVRHARTTAAVPMGVHDAREQGRFQHGPQFVRDAKAGCGLVVWCARTRALGCWFSTHTISIPVFRIGSYGCTSVIAVLGGQATLHKGLITRRNACSKLNIGCKVP